jgi:hypothetical protein
MLPQTGNKRGSFLSRDSSTLEKLAEMTKSASSTKSGSGAKNSKNFIFAVLSPPKGDATAADGSEKPKKAAKKGLTGGGGEPVTILFINLNFRPKSFRTNFNP